MNALQMAWVPSMAEMIIILVIVLLLFGSTKIPQLMRGMGQGIGEFKKGMKEGDQEKEKTETPKAESTPEKK